MICQCIIQSETSLIAPILPTVMTIVIDIIVQDGFRFITAHKNAQKKRNPKTYFKFQIIKLAPKTDRFEFKVRPIFDLHDVTSCISKLSLRI